MRGQNKIKVILLYFVLLALIPGLYGCSEVKITQTRESSDNVNYEKGRSLLDEGKPEEAVEYYLAALDELEDNKETQSVAVMRRNGIYNDLSEAYYQLQEYELSLEYIEKALAILPNDFHEYINRGNAFYSLSRNEEAKADYLKALSMNEDARNAIYGLGSLYFDYGEYEDALEMFQKYLEYDETDMGAVLFVIECYSNLGNSRDGLEFVEKMLEKDSTNYDLLKAKGEFLSSNGSYEEAEAFYKDLTEDYPDHTEIRLLLGEFYYNHSKYKEALDYFMGLSEESPGDETVNSRIIYCFDAMDEYEGALEFYQAITDNGYESYEICNAMGNLHLNGTMYMEAIPYFEEAIRLDSGNSEPYTDILYALYYGKRYSRCIEFGLTAMEYFPAEADIPWYIGDCYHALRDYDKALEYYRLVLDGKPDNEDILAETADTCLMLEDYVGAEEYADRCLSVNPENSTASYVKETVTEKRKPIGRQLEDFVKDSYLYPDGLTDTEGIGNISEGDISNSEITEAIDNMKRPDDIFTFVICDDEYDALSGMMEDEIEYSENGNRVYLGIKGFYTNTDNTVTEVLDNVKEPQKKDLIIDLRNNTGGLTDCANNILDILLGDCVTSTLISRDGYTYNYYSDASQLKFKKIYIFVNEYTASASELLTLGLKTYLDNVTIVGSNTYGKGVGQIVFEDRDRKLMVYLVNHYWNVREQNIMSTGIAPDIRLKSDSLEDYMEAVR